MSGAKVPRLIPGGLPLWRVPGFRCGAAYAGLKQKKRGALDVGLLYAPEGAAVAGLFTVNQAAAAPVALSRKVAARGRASAVVVNAGNANACTGRRGLPDARRMAELASRALGVPAGEVLVASTGVIGRPMDMAKVGAGIWEAALQATADGRGRMERAIMTTDLAEKRAACRVRLGGRTVTVAGISKGSGMIAPSMATMLGFIATDAAAPPAALRAALGHAAGRSFNCLTVDGQGSTNDSVFLLAGGASGARVGPLSGAPFKRFRAALTVVCVDLARQIARDGEGATKLVVVGVRGARSEREARTAARAVAESLLVKTATFGCDPNWGRILSAIGMTGARMALGRARVEVGGITVYDRKPRAFSPGLARKKLGRKEVRIDVNLRLGRGSATVYTCDLSYGYVRINAEYHT